MWPSSTQSELLLLLILFDSRSKVFFHFQKWKPETHNPLNKSSYLELISGRRHLEYASVTSWAGMKKLTWTKFFASCDDKLIASRVCSPFISRELWAPC